MVILDLKSYEEFISTVPAAGSVETKEQCIALLKGWVEQGPTEALLETANALSPVHYPALRGQLLYLWEDWAMRGEGTRKGVRATVTRILNQNNTPSMYCSKVPSFWVIRGQSTEIAMTDDFGNLFTVSGKTTHGFFTKGYYA